ncbi:hypothetical protein GCM10027034_03700 [Ramlibacter solisilvae]|uniref:Membrane protein n=1 Tax=Ramlibacter tataouinensis TaxID=94132 RepID=A0A127JNR1_9BURK|nr:hypothetical protein [Ramlibacter tataouinensis]AMO21553.1 membrane protein [Ramlibacter tataouinensis]
MFAGLQSHPWAYPVLEIAHIFGIGLLMGNLMLLEVRVFGRGAQLPLQSLARLALTVALAGFSLAAASGLLMFASQPGELLANRAFTLKMVLILVAGCNAAWFHGRRSLARGDALARLQLLASTLIWLAVLACGRWIAYV